MSCNCSFNADAALVGRLAATASGTDYQAYYDDVADLTWLSDGNYAVISGDSIDGHMYWVQSQEWVVSLDIEGVTGWRLPDTNTNCIGYDCTSSMISAVFMAAVFACA